MEQKTYDKLMLQDGIDHIPPEVLKEMIIFYLTTVIDMDEQQAIEHCKDKWPEL